MDNTKNKADSDFPLAMKIINGVMLLVSMILAVATFFAILDLVFIISTSIVIRTGETTVQQSYIVTTARNIWVFCGGILLLGFLVGAFDYYSRRLGNEQTSRFLLWTFLVEIIIIAISLIV